MKEAIIYLVAITVAEVVTIYYGASTSLTDAEQVNSSVSEWYPQLQVEIIDGGQPYYDYIVSIE